jgi:hypothetical protein
MQAAIPAAETARVVMAVAAVAMVAFWRVVIKWLIALACVAILVALGYGAIMIWQVVHRFTP